MPNPYVARLEFYVLDLRVYSIHEYHQIPYDKPHRLGAMTVTVIHPLLFGSDDEWHVTIGLKTYRSSELLCMVG